MSLDVSLRATIKEVLLRCEDELPAKGLTVALHALTHAPDDILYCGPWRESWCFGFERFMCYLRTLINSKKSPAINFAKRYCSNMVNHTLSMDQRRLIQVPSLFIANCTSTDNTSNRCSVAPWTICPQLPWPGSLACTLALAAALNSSQRGADDLDCRTT